MKAPFIIVLMSASLLIGCQRMPMGNSQPVRQVSVDADGHEFKVPNVMKLPADKDSSDSTDDRDSEGVDWSRLAVSSMLYGPLVHAGGQRETRAKELVAIDVRWGYAHGHCGKQPMAVAAVNVHLNRPGTIDPIGFDSKADAGQVNRIERNACPRGSPTCFPAATGHTQVSGVDADGMRIIVPMDAVLLLRGGFHTATSHGWEYFGGSKEGGAIFVRDVIEQGGMAAFLVEGKFAIEITPAKNKGPYLVCPN